MLFGTIDTFLIWRLTGGAVHVTDYSNASRTMLFNIHDARLGRRTFCNEFDIPRAMLPRGPPQQRGLRPDRRRACFGGAIPIAGDAGDQQAATFGQACFAPGMAKNTYGTGCFLLMNTGEKRRASARTAC